MTLCINNDQTWFFDTLTSARPLVGLFKPSPFTGFPVKPEISTYAFLFKGGSTTPGYGIQINLGWDRFVDELSFFINFP